MCLGLAVDPGIRQGGMFLAEETCSQDFRRIMLKETHQWLQMTSSLREDGKRRGFQDVGGRDAGRSHRVVG
jgi:hypothetical protein